MKNIDIFSIHWQILYIRPAKSFSNVPSSLHLPAATPKPSHQNLFAGMLQQSPE